MAASFDHVSWTALHLLLREKGDVKTIREPILGLAPQPFVIEDVAISSADMVQANPLRDPLTTLRSTEAQEVYEELERLTSE